MATAPLPAGPSCRERVEVLGYLDPQHNYRHAGVLSEALVYRTVLSNLADQDSRFKKRFEEINGLWNKSVDMTGSEDAALLQRVREIENVVLGMPAEMKKGVTEINCSDSPAIRIPEKLFEIFSSVKKVCMKNSCFSSLPPSIGEATQITSFFFSNAATCSSKLQELPLYMNSLKKLTTLQITSTSITHIHEMILKEFQNLRFVDISDNNFDGQCLRLFKACSKLQQLVVKDHLFLLTKDRAAYNAMGSLQNIKGLEVVDLSSRHRKKICSKTKEVWRQRWSGPWTESTCAVIDNDGPFEYTFGKAGITPASGG